MGNEKFHLIYESYVKKATIFRDLNQKQGKKQLFPGKAGENLYLGFSRISSRISKNQLSGNFLQEKEAINAQNKEISKFEEI